MIPIPYVRVPVLHDTDEPLLSKTQKDEKWDRFCSEVLAYAADLEERHHDLWTLLYPRESSDLSEEERHKLLSEMHELAHEQDLITTPGRGLLYFNTYQGSLYYGNSEFYRFSVCLSDGYEEGEDGDAVFQVVSRSIPIDESGNKTLPLPALMRDAEKMDDRIIWYDSHEDETIYFVTAGIVPIFQRYYGWPGNPPADIRPLT